MAEQYHAAVVYGPQGCGKTQNASAICWALGLSATRDNWTPGDRVLEWAVHLTNAPIEAIRGLPDPGFNVLVISFDQVMEIARREMA